MSNSNFDFTIKFFRPTKRPVFTHNGLLDSRTKRIIAQDRLIVAEQRILNVEKQKSASNLQLLAFEQKQVEKRLLSIQNSNQSVQFRQRSISEGNLQNIHQTASWNDTFDMNKSKLHTTRNSNVSFLPQTNNIPRSFSVHSDRVTSENQVSASDTESNEEEEEEESNSKLSKKETIQLPVITIIPPEDDVLFFVQ
ncbi:unnamed protein product [Rotaria sp. Silwood1]|nr:unnamed protein product [Rotaria sp. Silwood1]CAF3391429.1 unnamed protein product [Rotaria sp. Silwood1]CAF5124682.1 unnamed protein product [Rotaria sp. Silwood1]